MSFTKTVHVTVRGLEFLFNGYRNTTLSFEKRSTLRGKTNWYGKLMIRFYDDGIQCNTILLIKQPAAGEKFFRV